MQERSFVVIAATCILFAISGCSALYTSGVPKTTVVDGGTQSDSAVVIAGPEYRAGWLHSMFFGEHYRLLWTARVRVPVLDLSTYAGGLTPVEAGGGFQTKSLRFKGANGLLYKFRSADKDPSAVLPDELRGTFAEDLARDHISTSHPCAGLVVDEFAGALGIARLEPLFVLLPDDDRLGEFRSTFGGLLGVFERYPDDNFLGAEKVQNALKVFEAIDEDSRNYVDGVAYLKARLLDVFVGDWDRHVKQWKWARYRTQDGRKVWRPIPMDRDQAFVRLDGFLPWIAAMAVTQFEPFYEDFNDIYSLTYSGRHLDRRILTGVDKPTWDSVVAFFVSTVTDDLIDRAVAHLPEDYSTLNADELSFALKSRRNQLQEATDIYYGQLNSFVDVHLSDKQEFVSVRRLGNGDVDVAAWLRDKNNESVGQEDEVFSRRFRAAETREIRIFLHGGDDRLEVDGDVSSSIIVRVVGGKGDDELVDRSIVRGVVWGFVFFLPQADQSTYLYDHAGSNTFVTGPSCTIDESKVTSSLATGNE